VSEESDPTLRGFLDNLRLLQEQVREPVKDVTKESPALALHDLEEAVDQAPSEYREYLREAVDCYNGGQHRAAVLMVWAATVQHLFITVGDHAGGIKLFREANLKRFGTSKAYREIRKVDDFLYLKESQFLLLGEDCGMYNKTARNLLEERLDLRNRCGHPTGYKPGRGEVVIFIESLLQNIISGRMLNW
jgi:hypothetical protein